MGVRLVETRSGRVIGRSAKKVKLSGSKWSVIATRYRKKRAGSSLRVQIFAPSLRKRSRVLVDDVKLRVAPSKPRPRKRNCTTSRRGIPSCDAFFGASVGLNRNPASLENAPGARNLGIHRTFYQASDVDTAVRIARRDLNAGRLPWISFKLPHSWSSMAQGEGDAWARGIANRLSKLPGPVWVAFHHEPENDNEPIGQWTKLQRRLAPIVRQAAPNVAYTVILMGWHQFYGDVGTYGLNKIIPRTKIDVIGFDLYNRFGTPGSDRSSNVDLRAEYFQKIAAWTKKRDVEWAIGETGYTDRAFKANPNWLRKTFRDLKATGGIGLSYFNSAPDNATGDWLLDTRARVEAFTEVQKESHYLR